MATVAHGNEETMLLISPNVLKKETSGLYNKSFNGIQNTTITQNGEDITNSHAETSFQKQGSVDAMGNEIISTCNDGMYQSDHQKDEESGTTTPVQATQVGSILKFGSLSKKRKLLVVLCLFTYFLDGVAYALMAPFFPQVAAQKGMSLAMNGFVFSVFMLISFLTTPIFGSYLIFLGPKFVYVSGIFIAGVSTVLQGTVDRCPPGVSFTVITLLCRSVGAFGFAAYITAIMAVMVNEFPNEAATCFAILETSNGVGLMVGPSIGGLLYDLAGFGTPFYVTGILICVSGAFVYMLLPIIVTPTEKRMSRLSLFRSPMTWIGMSSTVVGSSGFAYLDPTLSNHLAHFGLSVSIISLFFVITPCMYAILSPFWGYLSDKVGIYRQIMVVGQIVFGISFFFIGPSDVLPFLPFEIWTVTVGLVIAGCTVGCFLVPTMQCMVIGAKEVGFEENIDTFAMVAGMLFSMFFLGAFVGPVASGFLVEYLGSSRAFNVIGVINIIMGVISFIFFFTRHLQQKSGHSDKLLEKRNLKKEESVVLLRGEISDNNGA